MSRKGTKCVGCGGMFHTCGSCGLVGAEWDYCRSSCYAHAGSPTHNADGEEYEGAAFWSPAPMPSRPLGRVMKPAEVEKVRHEGAAVAFGLMGMAEAIRRNHDPWYHCAVCGSTSLNSGGTCLSTECYVETPDRGAAK